jgi:hypothetical protein
MNQESYAAENCYLKEQVQLLSGRIVSLEAENEQLKDDIELLNSGETYSRNFLAVSAMRSMLQGGCIPEIVAHRSFVIADAMLKEMNRDPL